MYENAQIAIFVKTSMHRLSVRAGVVDIAMGTALLFNGSKES